MCTCAPVANLQNRGDFGLYRGDEFRGSEGGSDGDPQGIQVENRGSCESKVSKTCENEGILTDHLPLYNINSAHNADTSVFAVLLKLYRKPAGEAGAGRMGRVC